MRFRSFDNLRLFDVVARHLSFTAAASELNLSKGAVSYQIKRLERDLGFPVFVRQHRGIALTDKGRELWRLSQATFRDLEREISRLRDEDSGRVTVGVSTYFASRWLSARLMTFMAEYPRTGLRLQPLVDLVDLGSADIDIAIRWGDGTWSDLTVERLFCCPAFPTAGAELAARVRDTGIEAALAGCNLLQDRDESTAWARWFTAAGVPYPASRDVLVIPDPNVRVQAVIDGQGVALNDRLVSAELTAETLFKISEVALESFGYFLVYPAGAIEHSPVRAFRDWIVKEAERF